MNQTVVSAHPGFLALTGIIEGTKKEMYRSVRILGRAYESRDAGSLLVRQEV